MAIEFVKTRKVHRCSNPKCGREIPAGSMCLVDRTFDLVTNARISKYVCPEMSCYLPQNQAPKTPGSPQLALPLS
jgi:hypothetical protein